METLLFDLSIILIVATAGALLARWWKQPIIPAYIIAGVILGPILGWITDAEIIAVYAEIGIAFLLFIVGLELDLDRIKSIGWIASGGALVQVGLTFLIGFIATIALGFGTLESAYLGLVVAFSSTFVVIKLLSDKRQIDSLHGRIVIGMLLVQDIIAVLALTAFNNLGSFSPSILLFSFVKGLSLFAAAYLLSRVAVPQLFHFAAKSNELLFLSSLAMMFAFAMAAEYLDYSIAIGGFLAGLTLGNLPYQHEIIGRVKPLRDFFATLFFVSLGLKFLVTDFDGFLLPLTIIVVLVILVKPFILYIISSWFGYAQKTSFQVGLVMAQVSEFSLILLLQALNLGHISQKLFSFVVLVTIITIAASSYFVGFDKAMFRLSKRFLKPFSKLGADQRKLTHMSNKKYEALLIGCDRAGSVILKQLQKQNTEALVIDFNPELLRKLIKKKQPCMYGDINDPDIIEHIHFKSLWITISSVPNVDTNKQLIRLVKKRNKSCLVFVTANTAQEALRLYELGADYVILPHLLGGQHVALMLKHKLQKLEHKSLKHIKAMRKNHIDHLQKRL